jgi:hypothetical protein
MKFIQRFMFLVALLLPFVLMAQSSRTLKGVVTDENNEPMAGVSVTIKGTHKSVVTGYGQQAKKNITGSVTSLPAEEFNVGVISTPGELLAGKVAGINADGG